LRILAVDPGEKRIGIALSDPSGIIASPLGVVKHSSRMIDAASIAELARNNVASLIIVGQSLDEDGFPTPASRRAVKLADAIRSQSEIPVEMWDESYTTQIARIAQIETGAPKHKRRGHLDEMAAVVILQSYLDASDNA
jgi:putative Holliday junction resolvase